MLNVLFRSPCAESSPTRRFHSAASLSRVLTILFVGCGVLLGGCRVDTDPKIVSTLSPGQEAQTRKAPRRGFYRLYEIVPATGGARPAREELFVGELRKGERLGFVRQADGQMFAVAGQETQKIDAGKEHLWQMRASPNQIDGPETVIAIATVAVVVVLVLVVIYVQDFQDSFEGLGTGLNYSVY